MPLKVECFPFKPGMCLNTLAEFRVIREERSVNMSLLKQGIQERELRFLEREHQSKVCRAFVNEVLSIDGSCDASWKGRPMKRW